MIPVARRIGILDRKLRVVSENVTTEDEWRKYATHAVQSTYGYEYQGDNLFVGAGQPSADLCGASASPLAAQANRRGAASHRQHHQLEPVQMDGLHLSVPGGKPQSEAEQLDLFSMFGTVEEQIPAVSCKVKNWRSNKTQNF